MRHTVLLPQIQKGAAEGSSPYQACDSPTGETPRRTPVSGARPRHSISGSITSQFGAVRMLGRRDSDCHAHSAQRAITSFAFGDVQSSIMPARARKDNTAAYMVLRLRLIGDTTKLRGDLDLRYHDNAGVGSLPYESLGSAPSHHPVRYRVTTRLDGAPCRKSAVAARRRQRTTRRIPCIRCCAAAVSYEATAACVAALND